MKKLIALCLVICVCLSVSGCATKEEVVSLEVFTAAESQWNTQIQDLQQEIEELKQHTQTLQQTIDFLTAEESTLADNYTQFFNFTMIDGKYSALSVKRDIAIPEVLVVPNEYQGIQVAYTGADLISAVPVKTIIFESGVECSFSLCGNGNNCPTLEKIVFLSEDPKDCIISKLRYPANCDVPLQLNDQQISGGCLIYVPDNSVQDYIDTWVSFYHDYAKLIRPLSELDAETLAYIK